MRHASAEAYFDCTYASILPIGDVLAGSYRRPRAGEYPAIGIDTGEHPRSISEAVTWPWRGRRPAMNPLREAG